MSDQTQKPASAAAGGTSRTPPQHDRGDQRGGSISCWARDPERDHHGRGRGLFFFFYFFFSLHTGGVFRATGGPSGQATARTRVFDTPIQRNAGSSAWPGGDGRFYGLRPRARKSSFARLHLPPGGSISSISEAARLRYRSAGDFIAPLTVRSPFGGGIFGGQTHSQSPEAIFTHVCGLKNGDPRHPA